MNTKILKALSFITIILGFFMALLDTTIVNIALPRITEFYSTTQKDVSWVVNGYNLAFAVFIITASRVADQFGRKKIFIIGVTVFTLASVMCGLSNSLNLLIFFRVVQGLAGAIIVPVTVPMALELFSSKRHGTLMGVWAAISGLAAASGPALGGILTENFKWQWIFYVNIPVGIVTIILSIILVKESFDPTAGKRIDFGGTAAISIAMFSLTYALIQANDFGWTSLKIISLFVISVISFAAFFIIEAKAKEPMLPLSLLKILPFAGASLTLLFLGAGMMSAIFMTSFFLTTVMGFTVLKAGLTIAVMPLASIVTSAFSGPLSAKFGSRIFGAAGMLLIAVSVFLLGGLHADSTSADVIWRLLITGSGMGMTMAPVMGSSIRNTPRDKSGMVSGILNMTRALGTVLGVAILVAILNSSMNASFTDVKDKVYSIVQNDKVLDARFKEKISENIKNIKVSRNSEIPKVDEFISKIDEQEKLVLAKVPANQKSPIQASFKIQKNELLKLWSKMEVEIKNGMASAFDRTFKYGSIMLILGIIFALFSDRKRNEDESEPAPFIVGEF